MMENDYDASVTVSERLKRRRTTGGVHALVSLPPHRGRWIPERIRFSKQNRNIRSSYAMETVETVSGLIVDVVKSCSSVLIVLHFM